MVNLDCQTNQLNFTITIFEENEMMPLCLLGMGVVIVSGLFYMDLQFNAGRIISKIANKLF